MDLNTVNSQYKKFPEVDNKVYYIESSLHGNSFCQKHRLTKIIITKFKEKCKSKDCKFIFVFILYKYVKSYERKFKLLKIYDFRLNAVVIH